MEWKITFINSNSGVETEHDIPFELGQTVYYCKRKRNKYAVYKRAVESMWASNCYGIELKTDGFKNEYVLSHDFDKIFDDKQDAIDFCTKQNQRLKVKVYD